MLIKNQEKDKWLFTQVDLATRSVPCGFIRNYAFLMSVLRNMFCGLLHSPLLKIFTDLL